MRASDPARRTDVAVADGKTVPIDFSMKPGKVQWAQLTKYQAGVLLPDGKGKDVVLQVGAAARRAVLRHRAVRAHVVFVTDDLPSQPYVAGRITVVAPRERS